MEAKTALQLAKFAVETQYSDIPPEVVQFSKGLTLKTVAGMLAGSVKPSGRKMAQLIREKKLAEEVGVIGSGFKTSLWEAAFLDAFFAHASELEDDRFNGGVSWDITVIPPLFPLSEKLGLSGRALMEALVVGLEVHARTCQFYTEHLGLVVVPGAIGPAAGVARALGLGVDETAAAMGLAMAGTPISIVNFGTDAHYLESALQTLQGLIAAEMARMKMTSNPDIGTFLTGLLGKERVSEEKMVADLGRRWVFSETWIKKYPCCFLNHRQIDALLELKREHGLSYEDIETVEVHTSPADEPCNRPEPQTEGDFQFSFQHVLGAALVDGDVNLTHFSENAMKDARLKEARSKVKVVSHSDWSKELLMEPARISVKKRDGKMLSRERKFPIGSPREPLTMEQFRGLYAKFTQGLLTEAEISKTADAIMGLENLNDMKELMHTITLTGGNRGPF